MGRAFQAETAMSGGTANWRGRGPRAGEKAEGRPQKALRATEGAWALFNGGAFSALKIRSDHLLIGQLWVAFLPPVSGRTVLDAGAPGLCVSSAFPCYRT